MSVKTEKKPPEIEPPLVVETIVDRIPLLDPIEPEPVSSKVVPDQPLAIFISAIVGAVAGLVLFGAHEYSAGSGPVQASAQPQVPNRPPAFLKDATSPPAAISSKKINVSQDQIDHAQALDQLRRSLAGPNTLEIPLLQHDQTFTVPVLINDTIALNFLIDSGATDVSIPADVVLTLMRAGTIGANAFLGSQTYKLADGSTYPSQISKIRTLKVGRLELENVTASIAPAEGDLLLGQSFLARLKSWSIDNTRHILIIQSAQVLNDPSPIVKGAPVAEGAPRKMRTATAGGVPRRALRAPPSDAVIAPSGAVEGDSFEWTCSSDNYCPWPSSYRFVMRNKTNRDLVNIIYEMVFLNSANIPVHSVRSTLTEPLRANLAKIVSNDGLQGNGDYPGHDVRSIANAVQIRIVKYNFLEQ